FQSEIHWLDNTYRIDRLFIDMEGADHVVRIVAGLAHCVVLNDAAYCGDPRGLANASTLLANVTLPAILLVALTLAWPFTRWFEQGLRLMGLLPALAVLWAVDVPMVLWAGLWSLHVNAFAPDVFSPLLLWVQFVQSGGRLAIALVLAVLVVAAARWPARQP
ncbi:MAG: hypothetical protein V4532_10385, partial [Pseudomonadota bacterium]